MEIEWMILADAAQVLGNKLYLLGGGWDIIGVNSPFPAQHKMALALSIKVSWNETNQKHTLEVEIISESPATEEPKRLMKVDGQFEMGRPPGIRQGQDQRLQMAFDVVLSLDSPGVKTVVARLEGQELRRTDFSVVASVAPPVNR